MKKFILAIIMVCEIASNINASDVLSKTGSELTTKQFLYTIDFHNYKCVKSDLLFSKSLSEIKEIFNDYTFKVFPDLNSVTAIINPDQSISFYEEKGTCKAALIIIKSQHPDIFKN